MRKRKGESKGERHREKNKKVNKKEAGIMNDEKKERETVNDKEQNKDDRKNNRLDKIHESVRNGQKFNVKETESQ